MVVLVVGHSTGLATPDRLVGLDDLRLALERFRHPLLPRLVGHLRHDYLPIP